MRRNDEIKFNLPDKEVVEKAEHLVKAIRTGQKAKENKVTTFILKGGSQNIKEEVAGAIAYGYDHSEYMVRSSYGSNKGKEQKKEHLEKEEVQQSEIMKIEDELEKLFDNMMDPFPELAEEKEKEIGYIQEEIDELYHILNRFFKKEGFELEECYEMFKDFVEEQKRNNPKSYGNARLARNLFEKAKEVLATEIMTNGTDPRTANHVSREIVGQAIREMKDSFSNKKEQRKLGFCVS